MTNKVQITNQLINQQLNNANQIFILESIDHKIKNQDYIVSLKWHHA